MIKITWLGHSGFQFDLPTGEVFLIDPWLDNPNYPQSHAITRADYILITHGHGDHISSAPALAKQHGSTVIAIHEASIWLQQRGVEKVVGMNKGGSTMAGATRVTMTHAIHSSSFENGDTETTYLGDPAGYVVRFPGHRAMYFAGDTAVFSDMALIDQLYHPELAFLPIGDLYTMDPEQAALACRLLNPHYVIPMHWGTFPVLTGRPEHLVEHLADLPHVEVWTPEPGKAIHWSPAA